MRCSEIEIFFYNPLVHNFVPDLSGEHIGLCDAVYSVKSEAFSEQIYLYATKGSTVVNIRYFILPVRREHVVRLIFQTVNLDNIHSVLRIDIVMHVGDQLCN